MKTKSSFALSLLAAGLLQTGLVSSSNMPEYGGADRGGVEVWSGWRTNNFLNYEWPYNQTSEARAEFSAFERMPMGSSSSGIYASGTGAGMGSDGSDFWRRDSDSNIFLRYED